MQIQLFCSKNTSRGSPHDNYFLDMKKLVFSKISHCKKQALSYFLFSEALLTWGALGEQEIWHHMSLTARGL